MELYIIRHAWAGPRGDPQWPDDSQRPLTDEGRKRFAQVVRKLVKRGLAPGIIATSPMARCVQTAEVLAASVSGGPEVVRRNELLPGGDLKSLVRWTGKQATRHDPIAWVGHAPDVGYLAAELIGQPDGRIHFAKGAVAAIRFQEPPKIGQGELRWLVTAKVLGC